MTQLRDNTGKEELVEEIAEIWEPWGGPGGYYPDWVKVQRAKASITLISQAIERGDIPLTKVPPELPGEVDRWKGGKMMVRPYFSLSHAVKGLEIIALRKEETEEER